MYLYVYSQSLAIELPGNFNTPTPGRLLQTAIYGDVRHLNEVKLDYCVFIHMYTYTHIYMYMYTYVYTIFYRYVP